MASLQQVTSRRVPRRPSSSRRTTRCARASAPAKWRGRAPWWCVGQAKPARQHAAAVRHRGAAREAHQSPLVNLRDQRPAAVALLSARCDGAPATLARRRRRRIPPRALGKSGRERGESALAAPRPAQVEATCRHSGVGSGVGSGEPQGPPGQAFIPAGPRGEQRRWIGQVRWWPRRWRNGGRLPPGCSAGHAASRAATGRDDACRRI